MDSTQKIADVLSDLTGKNNFWYAKWLNYFAGAAFIFATCAFVFFDKFPRWTLVFIAGIVYMFWDRHRRIMQIRERFYKQQKGMMNGARIDPMEIDDRKMYIIFGILIGPAIAGTALFTSISVIYMIISEKALFHVGLSSLILTFFLCVLFSAFVLPPFLMACTPRDSGTPFAQKIVQKINHLLSSRDAVKVR